LGRTEVAVRLAASMEEHVEHTLGDLTERLVEFFPDWAVQILAKVEHKFHMISKTDNATIELWFIQRV
jgi:hypothetical protein